VKLGVATTAAAGDATGVVVDDVVVDELVVEELGAVAAIGRGCHAGWTESVPLEIWAGLVPSAFIIMMRCCWV
jgi:hypothetical protein